MNNFKPFSIAIAVGLALFGLGCQPKIHPIAGKPVRVDHLIEEKMTAFIFLSTECPISQNYTLTINALCEKYPQINFVGVFTKWHKGDEIQVFKDKFSPKYCIYQDTKNKLAKDLNATTTPEVVLVTADRLKVYQGAIDNWYEGLGKHRKAATNHYLDDAISAIQSGKNPSIAAVKPVGCLIEF